MPAGHRYTRRRPVLGTVLVLLGIPATVAGFAMLMIYGENMVLDGLGAFVLCFAGAPAVTIGFLLFRPGARIPGFRADYTESEPEVRRTLLLYAVGAPLIGFGLSGIVCAPLLAALLGDAMWGLSTWAIFAAGIVGVAAGWKMLAAKLPEPRYPRPGHADYEARFSSFIAGWLTAIGIVTIPATLILALSSDADPDTRWSVAIVFVAFGIAFAAFGGRLLRDRRILLRVDKHGLFWRKLGTVPWRDVVRAHIRIGRRVRNLVVTVREPDGASLSFATDLMGLDRTTGELATALRKWDVRLD